MHQGFLSLAQARVQSVSLLLADQQYIGRVTVGPLITRFSVDAAAAQVPKQTGPPARQYQGETKHKVLYDGVTTVQCVTIPSVSCTEGEKERKANIC